MLTLHAKDLSVVLDASTGEISSLVLFSKERLDTRIPLLRMCLRDREGKETILSSRDALSCRPIDGGISFEGFRLADGEDKNICAQVMARVEAGEVHWSTRVCGLGADRLVEWIEAPTVALPRLEKNNTRGNGGKILFPYNEGGLVDDWELRAPSWFGYEEPLYPSKGAFGMFPNMICSQFLSYIWKDAGLYMGAHDARRAVKGIEFFEVDGGIKIQLRYYCGVDYGEDYVQDFSTVWSAVGARWEDSAERYRTWLEEHPPRGAKKIKENPALPEWYPDAPLILTYPVRGVHDMDTPNPNRMYPYINALPKLKSIADATGARVMALLMHWEGTAPWAPPYVWPPFGGEDVLAEFRDALHKEGNLLGVYCSGFGYTLQSNLIDEYNKEAEYASRGLERGMCVSPEGHVEISRICTAQRRGVDICAASPVGREVLSEAYAPLFASGIDYAQILDQNHGGGQYFCYGRDHGHPPAPGAWMTESMQEMLGGWNTSAPHMLFGCESAASEPFIGNLLMSDNRYELNYHIGIAVPLYTYLYHEYLYNFMGNQVCSPFDETDDRSIFYRLAYSFAAGDSMTLVLDQDGNVKSRWGNLSTDYIPNKERILAFVARLTHLYKTEAKKYLYGGRMVAPPSVECATVKLHKKMDGVPVECDSILPALLVTSWEDGNGGRVTLLVNPTEEEQSAVVDGKAVRVPALDGMILSA